jgi:hypothetical protein
LAPGAALPCHFPCFKLYKKQEIKPMSDTELLMKEVQTLPEGYAHEVLDFISRLKQGNNPAFLSSQNSISELPPAYSPEEALRKSAGRAAARRTNPALIVTSWKFSVKCEVNGNKLV